MPWCRKMNRSASFCALCKTNDTTLIQFCIQFYASLLYAICAKGIFILTEKGCFPMQAPRRRLTPSQRRQLERLKKRRQRLVLGILGALCLFSFCMGRCSAGWVTLDVVSPSAAPGTVSQSSPKNSGQTDPLLTLVNDRNPVPSTWTVDPVKLKRRQSIDRRAYTALQQMMDDARAQGLKPVRRTV